MNNHDRTFKLACATLGLLVTSACSSGSDTSVATNRQSNTQAPTNAARAAQVFLTIEDTSNNQVVYNQKSNDRLQLSQGSTYRFGFTSDSTAGAVVSVRVNGQSVVNQQPISAAPFVYTMPASVATGTYGGALQVSAQAPGFANGNTDFDLEVACSPSQTASLVRSNFVSGVNVALAGGAQENLYSYSASGPDLAAVRCSWDFNGDGLPDRENVACGSPVQEYSNHVGSRNIAVRVIHTACNFDLGLLAQARTLPARTQSQLISSGVNFIDANVASTTSVPAPRSSMLNLRSTATNPNASITPVICAHNPTAGTFTINGFYGYTGKEDHGFRLETDGFQGAPPASGTVGVFRAARFQTDRWVDGPQGQISFNGSLAGGTCSGTATAVVTMDGTPCSGGQTSPVAQPYRMRVSGTFSCANLGGNDGVSRINVNSGAYNCIYDSGDSCVGGGGGGGGVPPQQF